MDRDGRFLSPEKAEAVYQNADNAVIELASWDNIGEVIIDDQANQRHVEAITKLNYIDVKSLKKRKFKVAIDTVNGAGGEIFPLLLKKLGCEMIPVNLEPNGRFAHTPEPLPENLKQLAEAVKENKADVGFAIDPDADRCAIVDNEGSPLGEEYTLALAVKLVLSKKMGRVAVNMSTSRASEDIANYFNCMFERSKVGEINVAEKMKEIDAIVGGEGNGGVILPELHTGRDAPVAVALTLQHLLEYGNTMRDLYLTMPQYSIVKQKVNIEGRNPDQVLITMASKYKDAKPNLLDGVKIDFPGSWVHLRKSNTEPIVRVMAEARTDKEAEQLAEKFMTEIKEML